MYLQVLQLNIGSQQSTIDNLNEKAQNLQQSSSDPNLSGQIRQIVDKYAMMCTSARDLQAKCEKNLKNHQLYRDSYMDTTDWLSATVDKMTSCSDVRGFRTAIEAQLQKILVSKMTSCSDVRGFRTAIEAQLQKILVQNFFSQILIS